MKAAQIKKYSKKISVSVNDVPVPAAERISRIRGNGAKAVIVCVYGNRAYEDTLVELEGIQPYLSQPSDFQIITFFFVRRTNKFSEQINQMSQLIAWFLSCAKLQKQIKSLTIAKGYFLVINCWTF